MQVISEGKKTRKTNTNETTLESLQRGLQPCHGMPRGKKEGNTIRNMT